MVIFAFFKSLGCASISPYYLSGQMGRNNCERRLLRRVRGCASAQRSRIMNEERRLRGRSIAKLEWSGGRAQLHNIILAARPVAYIRRRRAPFHSLLQIRRRSHIPAPPHTIPDHYRNHETRNCTAHACTCSTIHIHTHKQTEWKVKYVWFRVNRWTLCIQI